MGRNKFVLNPITGKFDIVRKKPANQDLVIFYRNCNIYEDTWLFVDNSLSNKSGYRVKLEDLNFSKVCVSNEKTTDFDIELYEHDGNLNNLVLLDTISITGPTQEVLLSQTLNVDKQLAARIVNISGVRPKNIKAEFLLEG